MNYSFHIDHFDTSILGFTTAKITGINKSPLSNTLNKRVKNLICELKDNSIVYATYRLPADEYLLIHTLELNGFVIVDFLLSFESDISSVKPAKVKHVRKAKSYENKYLKPMASEFNTTRFFNDPEIPRAKAVKLYEQWIQNSLLGRTADNVYVYDDGEIRGFISIYNNGYIPLVAVSRKSRRMGIGSALINHVKQVFNNNKIDKARIETQATNIGALSLYLLSGFRVKKSYITLRWKNFH